MFTLDVAIVKIVETLHDSEDCSFPRLCYTRGLIDGMALSGAISAEVQQALLNHFQIDGEVNHTQLIGS